MSSVLDRARERSKRRKELLKSTLGVRDLGSALGTKDPKKTKKETDEYREKVRKFSIKCSAMSHYFYLLQPSSSRDDRRKEEKADNKRDRSPLEQQGQVSNYYFL